MWRELASLRVGSRQRDGAAAESVAPGQSELGFRLVDLLLVALLALLLRVPSMHLAVSGDPDESSFILAAREVVHGHLPYVTYWDHKPLGSTMLIAAAMAAFGQSVDVVRALGMACVVITAWLLYFITRRVSAERVVALAAGLLYVAFSTRLAGASTMTEILLAPFTAGGVLLLMMAPDRRSALGLFSTFAAAGLAFGMSIWIKYVPAIPAGLTGAVALAVVLVRRNWDFPRTVGCGALFSAGLLVPTIVSVAVYWRLGAIGAFWDANFGFMGTYLGGIPDHPRGAVFFALSNTTRVAVQIWPLVLISLTVLLPVARSYLFTRTKAYPVMLVVVWLLGEMLSVAVQMKFYMSHYALVLPPLCVLSAIAIGVYADHLARPQTVALATALAVAFLVMGPAATTIREVAADVTRPDVPREIAKLIASQRAPGDGVFVPNYEPLAVVYFLAEAPLPTRYAFPPILTGSHETLIPVDAHAEVRRILGARPKFIVMNQSWRDDGETWDETSMGLIEADVKEHYVRHAAWKLPENKGTVGLFVRSD